jgi:hypothetical protein
MYDSRAYNTSSMAKLWEIAAPDGSQMYVIHDATYLAV